MPWQASPTRILRPHSGTFPAAWGTPSPTSTATGTPSRTATVSVGSATSDGQRFQVLRPHAKGGLGAVFVALDRELNREVALKQILERHADDPVSRQRFLLEAEVTGNLEHPGIVPVYGLGTDAGGRPYYAMRFIKGDSLKEAIERFHADEAQKAEPGRRSLELRRLLRCFTDVCNAVDYAHSRGVLHRDIKPANVIVGRYRETLLVDWGLAKAIGRSDPGAGERTLRPSPASGSSETLPGSAMGTPAYMSPEQAEGNLDRLGPRSDVYSLGATLYSLLTGQPPFAGEAAEVIRAVQRGEFRPPRAVAPSIDRALEAVCLKAMALKPDDRHGSARALAEDLERWMADEPVLAWREPVALRVRRWARRNRTAVTAVLVAVLAGVAGLAAVTAVQTRANGRLQHFNARLALANQSVTKANADLKSANDREKERFNLAMDAIRLFHGEVSEDLLLKEKEFEGLRTKLLKGAADFYRRLEGLLKGQTDRASRAALSKAYDELAELTGKIGDQRAALAVYFQGLAVRRSLAAEPGADVETKLDVARSLNAAGTLQRLTGDVAGARASHQEARRLAEEAETQAGAAERAQEVLGTAYHRFALMLAHTGDPDGAQTAYRKALAIRQKLVDASPGVTKYQQDLAMTHNNIGGLLSETGDPAGARTQHGQALAIRQKLVDANPGATPLQRELAMSHHFIGVLLEEEGDRTGARAAYDRALAIRQKLADANPGVTQVQQDLADIHHAIGNLLSTTDDLASARAAFDRALVIRQKLVDANPGVTYFQQFLAVSRNDIGLLLLTKGDLAGARAAYDQALAIRRKLADANPTVTQFQDDLAASYNNIAVLMLNSGEPAGALRRTARRWPSCRSLQRRTPASRSSSKSSRSYTTTSACCFSTRASFPVRGHRIPRRYRFSRSWSTPTPASSKISNTWRFATTTSAWSSSRWATRPELWLRMASPWRFAGSWPMQTRQSRTIATTWQAPRVTRPTSSGALVCTPRPVMATTRRSLAANGWCETIPKS